MLIPMHGDELLIVHFSEPKTHPIVGSSKRQRWQVRTSATRAREVEDRRNGRVGSLQVPCPAGSPLIQSHPLPGLSHPSFPAPLSHLPFPTVKPIMTSTPTNIWAFIMEFWGEGKPLRGALKPHLPVAILHEPELQGSFDRQSEQELPQVQSYIPDWGRKLLTWQEGHVLTHQVWFLNVGAVAQTGAIPGPQSSSLPLSCVPFKGAWMFPSLVPSAILPTQ